MNRQKDIYLPGTAGIRPLVSTRADRLEEKARECLSDEAFAYIAGGAGLERTLERNRAAFDRWQIVPRVLRDVSVRDLGIELLGKKRSSPYLLAPIGVLEMAHPEADLAVGRAAAAEGIPFVFSNQASFSMEKVAAEMGDAPKFFQLYWSKSDELTASFLQRAENCGCEALVVTLDTTLLGWRPRDLDLAFLPFLQGKGIAQYTVDTVFQRLMDEPNTGERAAKTPVSWKSVRTLFQQARRYPGSFWGNLFSGRAMRAVRKFVEIYSRPSITWEELPFLRQHTRLPILLKGVLHPDDARKALDLGMNGIVVSNHGGRQVDGAISTLEALPEISAAVGGRMPILFDSGIRSGADAFKALALGADAVCIGRPYVYALGIAGEKGVRETLANFKADLDLTMGLAGCANIGEITRERLKSAEAG